MQNLVGIDSVDLINECLVCRDTKLMRFDRDGILSEGEPGCTLRREERRIGEP